LEVDVSKHTPGPWSRKGNAIVDSEGSPVLRGTTFQDEEARANLDFAAAAPDLLAACEAMLAQIGRPGMAEARQKALDAVAKARGE
jgi:hypothetical protein